MTTTPEHTPDPNLPDAVPAAQAPQPVQPPQAAEPAEPAQPVPPAQPAVPPPPGTAPAKESSGLLKVVKALAIPLLIFVGFFIWKGAAVGAPKAGECVNVTLGTGNSVESVDTVKCDDAKAGFKVTGVVKNVSESDFNKDTEGTTCKDFAGTTASVWEGGNNGYVLCLVENTK